MPKKIIYDCDNTLGLFGKDVDDGLTLAYLAAQSDIELLGITTTFGNGTLEEVRAQTDWLAADLDLEDVPLHHGEAQRGQGPTEAAEFLAETAAAHPGEVTILATGPLGNLRAAQSLDAAFYRNVQSVVCMGGYLQPLRLGRRDLPELNLSADPEATVGLLQAAARGEVEMVLMNAQVCLQAAFGPREMWRSRRWRQPYRRAVGLWLTAFGLHCGIRFFYLWDLLPAVYVTHPELFDAQRARIGMNLADLEKGSLRTDPEAGAEIVMPSAIRDIERFKQLLFDAWQAQLGPAIETLSKRNRE